MFGLDKDMFLNKSKQSNMKRVFFVLSFLVCISFVVSASTFVNHLFWVNGTAYPFPMNYSESDLQIKGKVKEVKTTSFYSRLKFGKASKDLIDREQIYKFEDGRLIYYKDSPRRVGLPRTHSFIYESDKIKKVILDDKCTFSYTYDSDGRINEVKLINSKGGRIDTWMVEYK